MPGGGGNGSGWRVGQQILACLAIVWIALSFDSWFAWFARSNLPDVEGGLPLPRLDPKSRVPGEAPAPPPASGSGPASPSVVPAPPIPVRLPSAAELPEWVREIITRSCKKQVEADDLLPLVQIRRQPKMVDKCTPLTWDIQKEINAAASNRKAMVLHGTWGGPLSGMYLTWKQNFMCLDHNWLAIGPAADFESFQPGELEWWVQQSILVDPSYFQFVDQSHGWDLQTALDMAVQHCKPDFKKSEVDMKEKLAAGMFGR